MVIYIPKEIFKQYSLVSSKIMKRKFDPPWKSLATGLDSASNHHKKTLLELQKLWNLAQEKVSWSEPPWRPSVGLILHFIYFSTPQARAPSYTHSQNPTKRWKLIGGMILLDSTFLTIFQATSNTQFCCDSGDNSVTLVSCKVL